jgi:hypothetical protein
MPPPTIRFSRCAAARCIVSHFSAMAARREVESRWPAWRDERNYFKPHGRHLKGSLRSLLAG